MPWGVAAAAVAAGGAAYSSSQQAKAAKKAANAQSDAANSANDVNLQIYNGQRADQEPFRQAGLVGLNQYMNLLGLPTSSVSTAAMQNNDTGVAVGSYKGGTTNGLTADDMAYLAANPDIKTQFGDNPYQHYLQYGKAEGRQWPGATSTTNANPAQAQQDAFAQFRATPGYQFGLDEGTKAVQASAAARGGLNSGSTLKALTKYGNDYADQQGYTPYVNRLASLAGIGQTATNQIGQYGTNYANQTGQNLQNAGQATAQGIYGSANSWANGAQQIAGAAGQYLGSQYKPGGSNATLSDGMWGGI